jgi:hypothetical protein
MSDELDLDDDHEEDGVEVEFEVDAELVENDDKAFFDTRLSRRLGILRVVLDGGVGMRMWTRIVIRLGRHALTFESVDRPEPGTAKPRKEDVGFVNGDIEDDWADPLVDSNPVPGRGKDMSPSLPSLSNVPPLAKSWPAAAMKSSASASSIPRVKKAKKEQPMPVPVAILKVQQEHYPFPVTPNTLNSRRQCAVR